MMNDAKNHYSPVANGQVKPWVSGVLLGLYFLLLSFTGNVGLVPFAVPEGWPQPVYDFSKNPVTQAGFLLGNRLFYDPVLSRDSTISCASCHLSFTAFTHVDHRVSHGIYGRKGTRNASALQNLAWQRHYMWDGAVQSLEQQAIQPITHPAEMDNTLEAAVAKLNASELYRRGFYRAFGDSIVTAERLLQALSQFTVMLVSSHSKYDSVLQKAPNAAFTPGEAHGYALFKTHCASCHAEPLLTNGAFENNGLAPDSALMDLGRWRVTRNPEDSFKFKVPTLRNIAFSPPYFHDGRFNKLAEVLDHYTDGIVVSSTLAQPLRTKINLDKQDKKDLIAFLKTLSDKPFLYNKAFQYDFPDSFQPDQN